MAGSGPVKRFFNRPMKKLLSLLLLLIFTVNSVSAGISVVRSSGITLTGADGIQYVGVSGITLTGADGLLNTRSNGITLTGADGLPFIASDGITLTGADGTTYVGSNGISLTGADGITLTGADGITLTGADGITLTGADGTQYHADSIILRQPDGITLTGADGITLTGADGITLTGADGMTRVGTTGITLTGADGITLTGADGITLTGADGITLTGADSAIGLGPNGVIFEQNELSGITLTGADGITLTGADGITLTGADGITLTGADGITLTGADEQHGLQSLDPDLATKLNAATDDSNFNAVIVYHSGVTDADIQQLRAIGIAGGTRMRMLPIVYVTGTRAQIIAISRLASVRSIYGNRSLTFNSDPYLNVTGTQRVAADGELTADNGSLPVSGRGVTVAVLDTGINTSHPDLAGKVAQNVRLADVQSVPLGFVNPAPVENLANTDPVSGHGTFVAGLIAGSGTRSGGKFSGVASGSRVIGLSAGDINLMHVLAGFDYLLENGPAYNVRVVNCSFSANTVFDINDPVNVATKMLTDRGVNIVFSAGNSGSGNGTLNPYAMAPWVIGVGATDERGKLAGYSSRGNFGDELGHPSVVAPGTNIAGVRSPGTTTGTLGLGGADMRRLSALELPYYTTATGTSFSAPQVSGAIALMLEANPHLTPAEIKDILSRTATPLPRYFYHEAGAGMLNTYAAVLEAAFPDRRMGTFRSVLSKNSVRFITSTSPAFEQTVYPGMSSYSELPLPPNTVQAGVSISWDLSANDFGLAVYGSGNSLLGESNYLNLPVWTGRREKVVLRDHLSDPLRVAVTHTNNVGSSQSVYGIAEITRVEFPDLLDLNGLPADQLAAAQHSLLASLILPEGRKFRPSSVVTRIELADALLRAGLVTQYMASSALYSDVRDVYSRNAVESAQSGPGGALFYDAPASGKFYPHSAATRLTAAVALVKAAGLSAEAANASLPATVPDSSSIPLSLRGYAAIALEKRFLTLTYDGKFEPGRGITRIELAAALGRSLSD